MLVQSDNFISSFLAVGKFWKVRVAAFSCFLILIFSFPNYHYFFSEKNHDYSWDFIHQKVKDPFGENKQRLGTNEFNKQYRLTPILLAKMFHTTHKLRVIGFLTLAEHLMGGIFFYLALKLAYEITGNKVISSYFCLGFSFLFLGKDFFWDLSSWLIPFAYFFTLITMATRDTRILFLSLFLNFWSDERSLLFSPILFLWWKLYIPHKFNRFSLIYMMSILSYLGSRYYLSSHYIKGLASYALHQRNTGADYFWCLYEQFKFIPLGIALPFEGYWLFILFFLVYVYQNRHTADFKWFLLALVTFLGALIVSFSILDTTKSLALIFPLLFITLKLMHRTETSAFLKNTVMVAFFTSFLYPTYYFKGDFEWMAPIYAKPIREITGYLLNTFANI